MDYSICIARLDFQRIYVLNINTHITLTTSKETTHLSAWIALVQAIVCSGAAGKKFSAGRVFFCLWYVAVVLTDWIFVVYLYCFVFADIVLNQRSWEYPHDIMIYNPILCWIDFCRNPWAGVYKFPQVPQSSPATSQSTCRFKLNGRVPSIPASERLGFLFATTPWPWFWCWVTIGVILGTPTCKETSITTTTALTNKHHPQLKQNQNMSPRDFIYKSSILFDFERSWLHRSLAKTLFNQCMFFIVRFISFFVCVGPVIPRSSSSTFRLPEVRILFPNKPVAGPKFVITGG